MYTVLFKKTILVIDNPKKQRVQFLTNFKIPSLSKSYQQSEKSIYGCCCKINELFNGLRSDFFQL